MKSTRKDLMGIAVTQREIEFFAGTVKIEKFLIENDIDFH